ncbi:MAG: Serine/threonine-protein kinase PknD [Anaerolineae bacterium]|nr:Serine/threonine-protein kinase PknD [Anaerolineae bacterium]
MSVNHAGDSLLYQQLDEYRLEALLGHGGMARVYRGFDERLQRRVAIKVIDAPFRADPDYTARFEREARAIAQLKHPHIVSVYRYGEANGLLYLAMEYIDGANLAAILAGYHRDQKLMALADVNAIIRPICLALDYAHGQGVIHRDVTPSNIMLDNEARPILTDFGLALLDNQTRGEIFGTAQYMAPEQVVSSARVVSQSDLYSIGVILYEILTGQLPFDAPHPHDLAMLHLTESPPPPRQINPALSPQLEALLLRALAKQPEDRFASGAALAKALAKAVEAAPASQPELAIVPGANVTPERRPPLPDDLPTSRLSPPAKEGQVVTTRYLLKNIRALLIELTVSLTETELRQLYLDLPDFKPVHQQLAQSNGKAEIIDRLLEYAEQTLQLTELLSLAKELNPALYQKHQPYYESVSVGRRNLVGRSLGQYHLVERLGQGGMADVYKAYQPSLARYVAIKVIHSHLAEDGEFLERFEREAIAVAGLRHPNIVQVFDFAREDDLYYMVMEFVDGPTLEAELSAKRDHHKLLPLAETTAIFQALAAAIDYAHSKGVVHRDLKPANIMFNPDRRVVLTDFGIARLLSVPSYTTKNAVLGTPAYMSPEQAQGQPVDERSDIYSLGVILYEMVTGRAPYQGDNPVAILLELVSETWPPPTSVNPHLPAPVEQVVLTAMRQNPADRYPSAGKMAQALQQALAAGHPPQALANRPGAGPLAPPEIEVNLPPAAREAGRSLPAANSGQVAVGGQNVIQIGSVSGGQVSVGFGGTLPQPASPPRLDELRAEVRRHVASLQAQVESAVPADKQQAALERVAELSEALTASPPDLDTAAYVKSWLGKNIPALNPAVAALLAQPAVGQLMTAAGEPVAAEFARRLG